MNRITRLALAVIVFVTANIFQVKADDYDFTVNNVYYKVESMDERTCAVCAPNSTRTGEYQGDIVVPPTVTYKGATFTVIAIDKEAFWLCPITSIKLPNTLKVIRSRAFASCKNIINVKFYEGLKEIEEAAFANCESLKTINIPHSIEYISASAFEDCNNLACEIVIPPSCKFIGERAFFGAYKIKVIIEDGNKPLCLWANCFNSEKSIYIGRNIDGGHVGSALSKLQHLFSGLFRFKEITIGDNVSILPNDETGEHEINTLHVGYNLKIFPKLNADILKAIYVKNATPIFLVKDFSSKTYINATLFVPRGSKVRYQNAQVWKKFINIQEYDVQLASNVKDKNLPILINGHECVEMGRNLYWRLKNIGAKFPNDVGSLYVKNIKDSLAAWTREGWRLPTEDEIEEAFTSPHMIGSSTYRIFELKDRNIKYYVAENNGAVITLPDLYDGPELTYITNRNFDKRVNNYRQYHVRLVMDKSRFQKQQEEQRMLEKQKRKKAEEEELSLWKSACKRNTIDSYNAFISKYPQSPNKTEALKRISELQKEEEKWEKARRINTIDAYMKYINEGGLNKNNKAEIAIDKLYWQQASKIDNIEAYQEYLSRETNFSKIFENMANNRIDQIRKQTKLIEIAETIKDKKQAYDKVQEARMLGGLQSKLESRALPLEEPYAYELARSKKASLLTKQNYCSKFKSTAPLKHIENINKQIEKMRVKN